MANNPTTSDERLCEADEKSLDEASDQQVEEANGSSMA